MGIQKIKRKLIVPFFAFGALGLTNCGGITEDAKVANALQTIMAMGVEAAVQINTVGGATANAIECESSGTYDTTALNINNLADFISGATTTVSATGAFDFSNCKITLCGDTLTIDGDIDFTFDGALTGGSRVLTIDISASSANTTGIIAGTPEFDYKMIVEVENNNINDLEIQSADTPNPLNYNSKEYRAEELEALARGC